MDFYFSHARTGLKYGLVGLGFEPGDEILLPSLVCDVVVHPLDQLGILPVFYPVSPGLQPDWSALPDLVTQKTRGFMVVHYFGQPQDLDRCREFCRNQEIVLIEDNAHGYGGTVGGIPLGNFGEIGISSPRKSFGWRNGGILHWNRERNLMFSELPAQPGKWKWKVKARAKKGLDCFPGGRTFLRKMPDYTTQETGREVPIHSWRMDEEYLRKIKTFEREDFEYFSSRRRTIWAIWKKWADFKGLSPVFGTLAPGANPLAFPVRTSSPEGSRKWFQWGWDRGFYVHSWPALPRGVVENDPYTLTLWATMVCFPIEPDMDPKCMAARLGF